MGAAVTAGWRGVRWTPVTGGLLLVLLLAMGGAVRADDAPGVSRFLEPLRQQAARLDDIAQDFQAVPASEAGRARAKALGLQLVDESKALLATVAAFRTASTRRGLAEEFYLIDQSLASVEDAGQRLYRVAGVKLERPAAEQKDLRQLALEVLRNEVDRRVREVLARHGLEVLLEVRSWDDARRLTEAAVRDSLQREVDQATRRLTGLSFHDRASARQALRLRIKERVEHKVAELVVKVTGNAVVVELAKQLVVNWLEKDLWPHLREALRPKGNLGPRVEQSVATMEESRLELHALGSEQPASLVELRKVQQTIDRATGRLYAARYLERDLEHAGDSKLQKALADQEEHLRRAIRLTSGRFLLHRLGRIEKLADQQGLLAEYIRVLRAILAAMDMEPDPLAGMELFLVHDNALETAERSGSHPRYSPAAKAWVNVMPEIRYLDLDRVDRERDRFLKAGKPLKDFNRYRFSRKYNADMAVTVECNGQTRRVQVSASGQTYGKAYCFGLRDGNYPVKVQIKSSDGFQLALGYTLRVKPRWPSWTLASLKEDFQRKEEYNLARINLPNAHDQYTLSRIAARTFFAHRMVEAGATPEQVLPLYHEALQLYGEVEKLHNPFDRKPMDVVNAMAVIGNAEAYRLAARFTEFMERTIPATWHGKPRRERHVHLAAAYRAMANLAISTSRDIETARHYLALQMAERAYGRSGWSEDQTARDRASQSARWPVAVDWQAADDGAEQQPDAAQQADGAAGSAAPDPAPGSAE